MRFQVFLSLWSVTSYLCIDEIPIAAKIKVSNPKIYIIFTSKGWLCTKAFFLNKKTFYDNLVLLNQQLYVLLLVQVFAID